MRPRAKHAGKYAPEYAALGNKGGQITAGDERSDAIAGFKVDEFRDVLVPVKGVEEFVIAGIGDHKERARGHLLR
jgi:hypothetical protein